MMWVGTVAVVLFIGRVYWQRYQGAAFKTVYAGEVVLRYGLGEAKLTHGGLTFTSEDQPRATLIANSQGADLTLYELDGSVGENLTTYDEQTASMRQLLEQTKRDLQDMTPEEAEIMRTQQRQQLEQSQIPDALIEP